MTEVHLEPRHFVMIEQTLQEFIPEARFWCSDSRVHRRGMKCFSNLDLVVQNEEDLRAELGKLWDAFEASDLHIKVDLSECNQTLDWLKQDTLEEYVVLQEPAKTSI
ncbi:MAG: hypothetical protein ACJ0DI_07615 [bacterium]